MPRRSAASLRASDAEARRRIADANVVAAYHVVLAHLEGPDVGYRQFGAVHAIATGSPAAFFNPVFAIDPGASADDLPGAVAWVEGRRLPVAVQIWADGDPTLAHAAEGLGLRADPWLLPVMVLDVIPAEAPPPPPGVTIAVGGAELHDDWHAGLDAGPIFRGLFGPAVMADHSVRLACATVDGAPVAAAAAILGGDAVGIYAVGTHPDMRGRGIGRAVTSAAMVAGAHAWGLSVAILQSSEMGLPVYRSMGFEEVGRYLEFERPTV